MTFECRHKKWVAKATHINACAPSRLPRKPDPESFTVSGIRSTRRRPEHPSRMAAVMNACARSGDSSVGWLVAIGSSNLQQRLKFNVSPETEPQARARSSARQVARNERHNSLNSICPPWLSSKAENEPVTAPIGEVRYGAPAHRYGDESLLHPSAPPRVDALLPPVSSASRVECSFPLLYRTMTKQQL
ncbi:hypothetical protein EVAR_4250_1 [Eumeta japonica]|uniref:Uncharacterized protein n=1 Tax=Eumeta variegata TaxID=151549 RepID=A0A4C1TJ92_EUMVA|nr:hypothetical protein EVAR_4250_1 [Eumeta japonica]